jgi:hypothetical protein
MKNQKAGKERYKGKQGKVQRQARKVTRAGKKRYKGKQGKVQRTFHIILNAGLLSVYHLAVAIIGCSMRIYTGTFNYLRVAGDIQLP